MMDRAGFLWRVIGAPVAALLAGGEARALPSLDMRDSFSYPHMRLCAGERLWAGDFLVARGGRVWRTTLVNSPTIVGIALDNAYPGTMVPASMLLC